MCAGTHPFTDWQSQLISPKERYLELVERMQWMARRMQIFGVHVHVGVRAPEKAIPIVNALCQYIPHFLALSSSSPFWVGCDTGLASSRTKIFEGMPTAGLPYQLADWAEFEEYMETLISTKSIESVREVWWDVRPHPDFGTVELRICDGLPTLDEIGAVAALAQCLVEQFDTQLDRGYTLPTPASWVLRENKWRASRYGLDADIVVDEKGTVRPVRQAIVELVEELRPTAKRLGCEAELADVLRVLEVGASYQRQRAVAAAHDGDLQPVVDSLLAEMRDGLPATGPVGRPTEPARARATAPGGTRRDPRRRAARRRGGRLGRRRTPRELVATRRHLHAHPELAYAEVETTAYLEQRLRAAGPDPAAAAQRHRAGRRGRGRARPDRRAARRHRRAAAARPQGRPVRLHPRGAVPRLRARRPHHRGARRRPGAGRASTACPAGCAASSSRPRRRCPAAPRRGRRRRARRRHPRVRAALRPLGARRAASACAPAPSPRPATASTSRSPAPAGTPPGRT